MDSAGDFVIAWESQSEDGSDYGIMLNGTTRRAALKEASSESTPTPVMTRNFRPWRWTHPATSW